MQKHTGYGRIGTLSYQWKRAGADISGAKNSTYTLTADDIGNTITVSVSSSVETGTITSAATSAVEKADGPAAPTGLVGTACTTTANNDGKITGVTTAMEYQKQGASSWTAISGTTVTGLTNGVYSVRVAETTTHKAGASANVTVGAYNAGPATVLSLDCDRMYLRIGAYDYLNATVTPNSSQTITWSSDDTSIATVNQNGKVTGKGVGVTLIWAKTSDGAEDYCIVSVTGQYTLSFVTNGGTSVAPVYGTYGEIVYLNYYTTLRNGYRFDGWYRDSALKNPVSVIYLYENTTVYAKWTKQDVNPFVDVYPTDFWYDAINWAYNNDIADGKDATHFGPYTPVNRAEFVTFLWRAAGCPTPKGTASRFVDVDPFSYYAQAVAWAIEVGVTKGTSETTFSPDMICKREHVVTFLARYAGIQESTCYTGFTDVSANAYYAAAVKWAKDNGITEGTSATTFGPSEDCMRGQVIAFLYRWMVKTGKA